MEETIPIQWRRPDIPRAKAFLEHQQMVDELVEERLAKERACLTGWESSDGVQSLLLLVNRIFNPEQKQNLKELEKCVREVLPFPLKFNELLRESYYAIHGYGVTEKELIGKGETHDFFCSHYRNPGKRSIMEISSMEDDSLVAVFQFYLPPFPTEGEVVCFAAGYEEPIHQLLVESPVTQEGRKKVNFYVGKDAEDKGLDNEPEVIGYNVIKSVAEPASENQVRCTWKLRSHLQGFQGDKLEVTNMSPDGTRVRAYYPAPRRI